MRHYIKPLTYNGNDKSLHHPTPDLIRVGRTAVVARHTFAVISGAADTLAAPGFFFSSVAARASRFRGGDVTGTWDTRRTPEAVQRDGEKI